MARDELLALWVGELRNSEDICDLLERRLRRKPTDGEFRIIAEKRLPAMDREEVEDALEWIFEGTGAGPGPHFAEDPVLLKVPGYDDVIHVLENLVELIDAIWHGLPMAETFRSRARKLAQDMLGEARRHVVGGCMEKVEKEDMTVIVLSAIEEAFPEAEHKALRKTDRLVLTALVCELWGIHRRRNTDELSSSRSTRARRVTRYVKRVASRQSEQEQDSCQREQDQDDSEEVASS